MRVDEALPGDLVIRWRVNGEGLRSNVYLITRWPDAETVVSGPHQSLGYAIHEARRLRKDPSIRIWRDHTRPGQAEALELVEDA